VGSILNRRCIVVREYEGSALEIGLRHADEPPLLLSADETVGHFFEP